MRKTLSRREFLKQAGLAGASLAIPWKIEPAVSLGARPRLGGGEEAGLFRQRPGTDFIKFADPLPVPTPMPDVGVAHHYRLAMRQFAQKMHRDLPATQLWGYGASGLLPILPGPTIEARVNVPVRVRWINELPACHLLAAAVDHTLHGAERKYPEVRAVVHLHGGATEPQSDGYPEDWYSPTGVRRDGRAGP